jgi:prepilin-type N-terminal cleavage/methylation domain-containing protein
MEKCQRVSKKRSGFTIVELLTVMSVIAILISLLVPALTKVHDFANELQQAAQFHSIEVAIDMFVAESGYGSYPPSDDNQPDLNPGPLGADPFAYGGAQKLAEAIVGWDLLGYHPKSAFRSDGRNLDTTGTSVVVYGGTRQNIEERKGPFIELENANAYKMIDIYQAPAPFYDDSYVLCDVFRRNRYSGKKTGMPILYYRARTQHFDQDSTVIHVAPPPPAAGLPTEDDIYYYCDNMNLLALGTPENGAPHILVGDDSPNDWDIFESMILNTQITPPAPQRPYRAGSFILISAGKDGLYGTADDVMNFKKD